jgi:hypothetical protein
MPEEKDVKEHCKQKRKGPKDPNNQCESHTRQDDSLLVLSLGEKANFLEEPKER